MRTRIRSCFSASLMFLIIFPAIVYAQPTGLQTRAATEIGATISNYRYEEPSLNVKLDGYKGGLDLAAITKPQGDWFLRFEGRYEYGKTRYSGSGEKNGNPDWYYELRGLVGKDFVPGAYGLAPYVGLGFRYLFNDIRGVTSTGAFGYRRESQYLYLPIGVTHRLPLESGARLSTTIEADYLLKGRQISSLSDVVSIVGDVTNDQRSGYGIRGSLYYEKNRWLFGPWFQYWSIGQSDVSPVIAVIGGTRFIIGTGFEPKNKTTEIGLRLAYKF